MHSDMSRLSFIPGSRPEKSPVPALAPCPASPVLTPSQTHGLPLHIVTDTTPPRSPAHCTTLSTDSEASTSSTTTSTTTTSTTNSLSPNTPLAFRGHRHNSSSTTSFSAASSPSNRTKGPPLPLTLHHSNTTAFIPKPPSYPAPPIPSPAKPSPRRTAAATPTQLSPFPPARDFSRDRERALESIASVRRLSGLDPLSGRPMRSRTRARSATAPSRPGGVSNNSTFRHVPSSLATMTLPLTPTVVIQEASPIDGGNGQGETAFASLGGDITVAATATRGRSSSAGSSTSGSRNSYYYSYNCQHTIIEGGVSNTKHTPRGRSTNLAAVSATGDFSHVPSPSLSLPSSASASVIGNHSTFPRKLKDLVPASSSRASTIAAVATTTTTTTTRIPPSETTSATSTISLRPVSTERASLNPCILSSTNTTTTTVLSVSLNSVALPSPLSSSSSSWSPADQPCFVSSSSPSASASASPLRSASSTVTIAPPSTINKPLPSLPVTTRRVYGSRARSPSDTAVSYSSASASTSPAIPAFLNLPSTNLHQPLSAKTSIEFARLQITATASKVPSSLSASSVPWPLHSPLSSSTTITNSNNNNTTYSDNMVVAEFAKELDGVFGVSSAPHSAPLTRPVTPPAATASQPFPPTPRLQHSHSPKPSQPIARPIFRAKPKRTSSSSKASRWIPDDVFQRFRRVEPTEILNMTQIQELKAKREAEEQERRRKKEETEAANVAMVEAALAEREPVNVSLAPQQQIVIAKPKVEEKATSTPAPVAAPSAPISSPVKTLTPAPVVAFSTTGMTSTIRKDFSAPVKPVRPSDLRDFPSPPLVSPHPIPTTTATASSSSSSSSSSIPAPPPPPPPPPPLLSALRRPSSPARKESLPTIPEVSRAPSTITPPPPQNRPSHSPSSSLSSISSETSAASALFSPKHIINARNGSISSIASSVYAPEEDEDYIYFHAAPTSKTAPTFSHGRIRISKADSGIRMSGENNLNWTAFQMAILGTDTPGGVSSGYDSLMSPISEAGDIDELDDWLSGLQLADYSSLVTTRPFSSLSISSSSRGVYSIGSGARAAFRSSVRHAESISDMSLGGDSASSTPRTSDDIPRPSACLFPGIPEPKRLSQQSQRSRHSSTESLGRWKTRESFAAGNVVKREIEVPRAEVPKEEKSLKGYASNECVAMGYNLHDLGDFLQYEAQHVYAGDPHM